MGLVKATRSFYNDSVGTRAEGEVFEVRNAEVCNQLEQLGYVAKVEGQEAQANQDKMQEQMGKKQALTNEAVSLAHHEQNQKANQHTQKVAQQDQQRAEQAQQQQQNQSSHQDEVNKNNAAHQPKATSAAKKANEK